jgi:NifU-like protein involved in Fe-S cluster formation
MSPARSTRPLLGRLERPDGEAERTNHCGDVMRIQVNVERGDVVEAAFTVQGCASALAAANAAAALARGRSAADVLRSITAEAIAAVLDGMPEDHFFLAEQARDTLHGAVRDALINSAEDWKKLYR